MQKFNGYDEAKKSAQYSGSAKLPKGAYVCKILGVKLNEASEGKSGFLQVQFDIAEGDYKGFFKKQYDENANEDKKFKGKTTIYLPKDDGSEKDGWTKTAFARWTDSLEASNNGYTWDWDEKKWKDKKIGIVFGETGTNIDGKDIVYVEAHYPVAVSKVAEISVDSIKFKKKKGYGSGSNSAAENDGFMNIPDDAGEELPW